MLEVVLVWHEGVETTRSDPDLNLAFPNEGEYQITKVRQRTEAHMIGILEGERTERIKHTKHMPA